MVVLADGADHDGDDSGPVIDLGDAGFAVPECTGAILSSLTSIIRLRVHPDGSLFALGVCGALNKYTVDGDASTDCHLNTVAGFKPDVGLHDFDFDAAGDLFTMRSPSLNSAVVEKRDPAPGAITGATCSLGGDSNAYWGRLAISEVDADDGDDDDSDDDGDYLVKSRKREVPLSDNLVTILKPRAAGNPARSASGA